MIWPKRLAITSYLFGCLALAMPSHAAGPSIELVIGPAAPKLEQFAAAELADQLRKLFDGEVRIVMQSTSAAHSILLGSPATNPAVSAACGSQWPQLSDQGYLLRTVKHKGGTALVVGGTRPQGTLWAAYELGHRFGMRSLLQGDFPPVDPRPFSLDGFDAVMEPTVRVRAWQTLDGGPIGWEAWGLADHQRILRQLAKLKFNRVLLALGPTQPYVHFEAAGVKKGTGVLFSGRLFRVDGDTAGRTAFRGANSFNNPDFSQSKTYEDRSRAGVALVRGIIDSAHELGMSVSVRLSPGEFPPEIAASLAAADDSRRLAASVAQLRACLETYPRIDAVDLSLPTEPDFAERAAVAWQTLLSDQQVVKRAADHPFEIHFEGRGPQSLTTIELSREAAGVLPQRTLAPLSALVAESRKEARYGWVVRTRIPSDAELGTYYLARSAFDAQVTPDQAIEDLITTIAGQGIAERLMKGFQMVEQAAQLIDKNAPGFATPDLNMVLQHAHTTEPPPQWWAQARDLYTEAMNEMYRGNTRARDGGRGFILYYARRYEFGLTYLASLESLRQAAVAKSKGDVESQQGHLEAAVEGMYNALGAFSEVARDPSDRGVLAVLNEFGYRPLMTQLQESERN